MLSLKGFSQVFNRGRSNDGKEAKELLETVDDLLTQSNKLLGSISRRLPPRQFETFEFKYTQLNLMVIDIKDDVREREQKRIFFENDAEKEAFQSDIRKLLQQCETYRKDVVSASRRVQEGSSTMTSENTSSDATSEQSVKTTDSISPWVSFVADTASQGEKSESGVDTSGTEPTRRFIATVSYDPRKEQETGDVAAQSQGENPYFRILICGDKHKRAVVVDTKPHYSDEAIADETDRSQDDLLRVGDMLMKSDPQKLEGHQVVDSYRGPSFIASFISTFTYNSTNMLTGGMV